MDGWMFRYRLYVWMDTWVVIDNINGCVGRIDGWLVIDNNLNIWIYRYISWCYVFAINWSITCMIGCT
jgi:protein associated with RNAse G/E